MNIKPTLDKRRARKDGSYPIIISLRGNNVIRVSTEMYAIPQNWNDSTLFNSKESNYKIKNLKLKEICNQVERYILSLEEITKTDKQIREEVNGIVHKGKKKEKKLFIDYLDAFIETKDKPGTRKVYVTTRNKIQEYDPKCTFETMDKKWLERFEKWMAGSGMKVNGNGINLRNIRAVFNWAIDEEYTTCYPFRKFRIKQETTRKRSLTVEQLRQLRDYPCEEYQQRYIDMFMLMFYLIGINAVDLFTAKPSAIVNGRFEYTRAKTGRLYSIKVEPEAMEIINKYRGKEYLLNIMDEYRNHADFIHRMGNALKKVGELKRVGRGGKKVITPLFPDISSYWSRHTWATIAASLDVPKETIAHALGHAWATSTTTDIYIMFDNRKIDEANRKVIDFVNKDGGY